ncbi:sodium:calcium antiporter [Ruminiclostridium cellulolyticum]|uniref:Sodium/calcium exchanger membrane region n=1 Tax=Ruminiclostridium cellulolyticum (strain ATCC 35319 / DSM 5812 / JCM 6584 / H10) TaxID=394503 RepID=B8I3Z8_RUMCH|nr:sodium:calcium antiporter [Ruminiclostridium cellulolyticum]ACL76431.1 sodium/calcium exchanger membrane region [Ruminiclostridium cellulolyticum H10]
MLDNILILLLSLGIILTGCELFTNGIEWLGKNLKLGDGVVGSIFSAVGTCLPETLIPVIALLFSGKQKDSVDIGIGAIIGAPFMLSTLAFFITGLSVIIFAGRRQTGLKLNTDLNILGRDIQFFVIVYTGAVFVSFVPVNFIKNISAILLIAAYVFYVFKTVNNDKASNEDIDDLIFAKTFKFKESIMVIILQITLALFSIIIGAEMFVGNIKVVSGVLGVSTLVLSIIITPIATELPEKFNSVIWISKSKDTLSLGNISGAMVFQSCIPFSIGILTTDWKLDIVTLISSMLALASTLVTYIWIKVKKNLTPLPLLSGGVFYAVFIGFLILRGFK